jgi:hypothetical protein
VYWSDFNTDTLYRVLLTQLPCRDDSCTWLHTGIVGSVPVFTDANYVYVDEIGSYGPVRDGALARIPKTCTSSSCIETMADQLFDPGMALDGTHVYWTDYETTGASQGKGTIRRLTLGQKCSGDGCELVLSGDAILGALLTDSQALYFSSRLDPGGTQKGEASIMRLAK